MRYVAKNSFLVLILVGLFGMPLMGFGFLNTNDTHGVYTEEVLGAYAPTIYKQSSIKYLDQIELKLNLSQQDSQTFYNVIPEEYLGKDLDFLVIYDKELRRQGVEVKVFEKDFTADLMVTLNQESLKLQQIDVTIAVLK